MNQKYFSDKQTAGLYGVNRGTVWRWYNMGNFPAPIKLSKGCTRWKLSDLQKWEGEKGDKWKSSGSKKKQKV